MAYDTIKLVEFPDRRDCHGLHRAPPDVEDDRTNGREQNENYEQGVIDGFNPIHHLLTA
jgi:hypothetical protein